MTPQLKALLDRLPSSDRIDLSALMEALYAVRHTGAVTFHLSNGIAKQVDLGPPIRLSIIDAGANGLDTAKGSKAG